MLERIVILLVLALSAIPFMYVERGELLFSIARWARKNSSWLYHFRWLIFALASNCAVIVLIITPSYWIGGLWFSIAMVPIAQFYGRLVGDVSGRIYSIAKYGCLQ